MIRIRHILPALLCMALGTVQAQTADPAAPPASQKAPAAGGGINAILDSAKSGGDEFLPPDKAFRFDALAEGTDRVRLNWEIADGYYLYRARIKISTTSPSAQLGAPQMPPGQFKTDEYFGKQEIYHHELIATVPVARARGGELELPLQVTYQGCAEAGLCYPPITKTVAVKLTSGGAAANPAGPAGAGTSGGAIAEQDRFAALIRGDPLVMIGVFFLAGLVLAFTPCVLPMVPILSGIMVGGGRTITTSRGFSLSLTYVLGMAVTYTAAGIAAAAAGRQVQAMFQQWWVIALFAALFVVLGAVDARSLHAADAGRHPDTHREPQQPPVRRDLRRRGGHGRALGSHRHDLRRPGSGRSAAGDQSDRPDAARRGRALCHEHRHGHAAAGRSAPPPGSSCRRPGRGWTW